MLKTKWGQFTRARFTEGAQGKKFKIVIIESGLSKNRHYYPEDVLKKAAPLFEGTSIYAFRFASGKDDHLPGEVRQEFPQGRIMANHVGFLEGIQSEQIDSVEGGKKVLALTGNFVVTDPQWQEKLRNIWEAGYMDKLGFSIDVEGFLSSRSLSDMGPVKWVDSIEVVNSTDLVTLPAAGGRFSAILESLQGGREAMKHLEKVIAFIKKFEPSILEGVQDTNTVTEQQWLGMLSKVVESAGKKLEGVREAEQAKQALQMALDKIKSNDLAGAMEVIQKVLSMLEDPNYMAASAPAGSQAATESERRANENERKANENSKKELEAERRKMQEATRAAELVTSQAMVKEKLAAANLPQPMREAVEARCKGKILQESEIDKEISTHKELASRMVESGVIRGMGNVHMGLEPQDVARMRMDLMFGYKPTPEDGNKYKGLKGYLGLREAYVKLTGDSDVSFQRRRMTEATSSDYPFILGTSMEKAALQEYSVLEKIWEKFASVVPVGNFKLQERVQWGFLSNVAIVAEEAAYPSLTKPSEYKATYTAAKRGGLFSITREMILGDDLQFVRRIPRNIARSAHRALEQFVHDLILSYTAAINDTAIYDTTVLYTVGHGNLGSSALSYTSLRDGLLAVKKQKDPNSLETLGIKARWLLVPWGEAIDSVAQVITNSQYKPGGADNDINDVYKAVEPVASPYLRSDANNWYLLVDKAMLDWLEVGFVNGQEEPAVLVQDSETEGAVFTNDKITYKVRHEYGGAVTDFRGAFGAIVA